MEELVYYPLIVRHYQAHKEPIIIAVQAGVIQIAGEGYRAFDLNLRSAGEKGFAYLMGMVLDESSIVVYKREAAL